MNSDLILYKTKLRDECNKRFELQTRLAELENRHREMVEELERQCVDRSDKIEHLEKEVDRLSRVNLCVVAVKLDFEIQAKDAQQLAEQEKGLRLVAEEKTECLQKELAEMEGYIDELQEMVAKAEEMEKLSEDQMNMQVAAIEAKDMQIVALKREVKEMIRRAGRDVVGEMQVMEGKMNEFNRENITLKRQLVQANTELKNLRDRVKHFDLDEAV